MSTSPEPQGTELTIEELNRKLQEQADQIKALDRTKTGLLQDLTKKKGVDRILRAAGIDPSDEEAEERIAQLIAESSRAASTSSKAPEVGSPDPATTNAQPAAPAPADAATEALRAELASLRKQLDKTRQEVGEERAEKERERKARQEDFKRSKIVEALQHANCQRPGHIYTLLGKNFRLLDDGETIVYGSEDDPKNISDAIAMIEQDDEYSIYFPGSGATGSGLPPARSSATYSDNPFCKSTANATKAAEIIDRDPSLARRLQQAARARGDLDPILGGLQLGR